MTTHDVQWITEKPIMLADAERGSMKYTAMLAIGLCILALSFRPIWGQSMWHEKEFESFQAHRPPDAQVIAGLRYEAHKRGLRFNVFCIPNDDGSVDHYQADAFLASTPEDAIYYEDGRRDWWAYTGTTAIEAAYALYLALANHHAPNEHPDHRPKVGNCNYNAIWESGKQSNGNPCGVKP